MLKFDLATISIYILGFSPVIVLAVAIYLDRRERGLTAKPPQTEKLLRPPGYSLSIWLDQTIDRVLSAMLFACLFSMLGGFCCIAAVRLVAGHGLTVWALLFGVPGLLLVGLAVKQALQAFNLTRDADNIRLGLRGEQAVAEALHEVADSGFRAFHDIPGGDNWNIDHVAVGPRGVFLIETKARRRHVVKDAEPTHKVTYDGQGLRFPDRKDSDTIPQAVRNTDWLTKFLTKRAGEPITVQPLVVLPGWYIETKGNFPVKVMNARYLEGYLRSQPATLDPAQVSRIVAALEDKCRDVEF